MIKLKTSLTEQDYYELDPFDSLKDKKEFVTIFKNIKIKGIVYCQSCITDDFIDCLGAWVEVHIHILYNSGIQLQYHVFSGGKTNDENSS